MNEEMDGAMQQAPQPGRQSIAQRCVLLSINRLTHIMTENCQMFSEAIVDRRQQHQSSHGRLRLPQKVKGAYCE